MRIFCYKTTDSFPIRKDNRDQNIQLEKKIPHALPKNPCLNFIILVWGSFCISGSHLLYLSPSIILPSYGNYPGSPPVTPPPSYLSPWKGSTSPGSSIRTSLTLLHWLFQRWAYDPTNPSKVLLMFFLELFSSTCLGSERIYALRCYSCLATTKGYPFWKQSQ